MRLWARHPRVFERLTSWGERGYIRGFRRAYADFGPDVVVSTYNLAGQMLGRLRAEGAITVPVVAYVTDAGAHPYWVARGVDLHLAPLELTADELRARGAASVRVVTPLVATPATRVTRSQAREAVRLPMDRRIVLVNGGSWGVGDVVGAARAAREADALTVVLCGRSDRLYAAARALPDCVAVGWTDSVATWLAAADVLVDNAGGTTGWEAILAGRPVVLWRPLAGHGRFNADVLARAGLVTVAWTPEQLRGAILPAPAGLARVPLRQGASAADRILAVAQAQRGGVQAQDRAAGS
jgi:UDP-N-acetylglucosamine:LPS N-acetylglucosamine transferase